MAAPRPTPITVFSLALAVLCVANVVPRAGRFSGDAMIHLGIAERAAEGGWFEFNPAEVTSATTSPAWTALEAGLLALGGYRLALPVISVLSLAALAGAAVLVRRLALRLGASSPAASVGALLFASLPGVASNAPLGMESGAFACASSAFLLGITMPGKISRAGFATALGALLGLCVLLRPEGVLLVAPVVVVAWDAPVAGRRSGGAALAVAALAVVAPLLYAHWRITGRWLPGSGLSRIMAARRDAASVHLGGPAWLYLAAPARLLLHLPLMWLAAEGARSRGEPSTLRRALLVTIGAALALYTFVTGAAHVARLTQWLWALLASLAAVGLSRKRACIVDGDRSRSRWLAAACVAHVVVAGAETAARWQSAAQVGGGIDRASLLRAIDRRSAGTERVLRALCSGGCCRDGEVPTVAVVEVQRRLTLDRRVSVASLDGVTAPVRGPGPSVTFDPANGCPRVDPVLAHPSVLGVFESPSAQLPRCAGSPLARSLSDTWGRPALAPPGWQWDTSVHGWIRRCDSPDQPSAASSIASASRTVANRTAARPTSP